MKTLLKLLFGGIFLYMVTMTTWVSLHKPITASGPEFTWAASPWAVATLFDAYFEFVTFFVWVAFKERTLAAKLIWFILIMILGNIAMSAYVLIQLFRLKPEEPASSVLWAAAR
jgi:Protein of unknown function (DUF1475)